MAEMLNCAKYKSTHAELFFFLAMLILNVQKRACVVSARTSTALVIVAEWSTPISSNSLNKLSSARRGARSDAATAAADLMLSGTWDLWALNKVASHFLFSSHVMIFKKKNSISASCLSKLGLGF